MKSAASTAVVTTGAHSVKQHRASSRGVSTLMYAAQQGNVEGVRKILRAQSSSLFSRDRSGKSALHYCCTSDNICAAQAADLLVMAAPDLVEGRDEDGFTPLHLAVIAGNMQLVTFLLANNADVNAVDNEKHTVVHWATVCGETAALRAILAAGAPVSTPDVHGGYPLHYAAQMCGGDKQDSSLGMQVLQTLLTHSDIVVTVKDGDKREPLLWAASAGSTKAVLALIRAGAAVETFDKDGLTALHCAASRGHTDCIDSLLTLCGASPDVIDSNGCTALHYAVTLGHADATALLLAHGADSNRQDRKGRSSAHCGCAKGQFETVKLIGAHGANLWLRNARGDLPLHEAAASGRRELVKWLLEMRPSQVNARNNDGKCPLHMAALNDNADMCKILLDAGAHVNPILRTSKNIFMTPLDCALQRGFRSTAKYLQLHGGVPANRLGDQRNSQPANSALSLQIRDDLTFWGDTSSDSERENGGGVEKNSQKAYRKKFAYKFERKRASMSGSDVENAKVKSGKARRKTSEKYNKENSRNDSALSQARVPSRKKPSSRLDYSNEIIINGKTEINIHQTKEIVVDRDSSQNSVKVTEQVIADANLGKVSSAEKEKRPKSAKYSKLSAKSRTSGVKSPVQTAKNKETVTTNLPAATKPLVLKDQSTNTSEETVIENYKKIDNFAPFQKKTESNQLSMTLPDQQSLMSNTSEDVEEQTPLVVEAAIHQPPKQFKQTPEEQDEQLSKDKEVTTHEESKVEEKLAQESKDKENEEKSIEQMKNNELTEKNKETVHLEEHLNNVGENLEKVIAEQVVGGLDKDAATEHSENAVELKKQIASTVSDTEESVLKSLKDGEISLQNVIGKELELKNEDLLSKDLDATKIIEKPEENLRQDEKTTKDKIEDESNKITSPIAEDSTAKDVITEKSGTDVANQSKEEIKIKESKKQNEISQSDKLIIKPQENINDKEDVTEISDTLKENDDNNNNSSLKIDIEQVTNEEVSLINNQIENQFLNQTEEKKPDKSHEDKDIIDQKTKDPTLPLDDDNQEKQDKVEEKNQKSREPTSNKQTRGKKPKLHRKKIKQSNSNSSDEEEQYNSISSESSSSSSTSKKTHRSFRILDDNQVKASKKIDGKTPTKSRNKSKPVTRKDNRSRSEESNRSNKTGKNRDKLNRSKIPTPLAKTPLSKSDRHLDQINNKSERKVQSSLDARVPSLPNIHTSKDHLKEPFRSESNMSAPLLTSIYSDHEKASASDMEQEERTSSVKKRKIKRRSKTREAKSDGSDYESSNLIDSGFEPSPRSSRIPKWKNMSERGVNMTSVTQSIQSNIRKYHLERKIFQHLLELKRNQIRAGQHNEAILVKRAIDSYHQSCASTVGAGRYIPEDYSFKSFEKFLYQALRKLQKNGVEHLKGLPETQNPLHCTQSTHRCMHATHAYTGIPCAAYLPKMDHHTIPKIGFNSTSCKPGTGFLPTINQKKAVTLELSHGSDKQIISLPTDRLDQNKRYYVTFTVKGHESTTPPIEENGSKNVSHRHSKSD